MARARILETWSQKIGDMRVKKGFEHREGADAVFSALARGARVDGLLSELPLNS